MKKTVLRTIVTLGMVTMLSASALANGNSNSNNSGDTYNTTNNTTNTTNNNTDNSTHNTASATGGAGGSVFGSGNSANNIKNDVTNNLSQGQGQSQKQHQAQSQSSVNLNSNKSVSSSSNKNTNVNGVGNSGNSDVNIQEAKNPVNSAIAPALAAGQDTCMGSSSAGGQGVGLGLSFGSTWTDEECVRRKNAAFLNTLGRRDLALAIIAQSPSVASAIEAVGSAEDRAVLAKIKKKKEAKAAEDRAQYTYNR